MPVPADILRVRASYCQALSLRLAAQCLPRHCHRDSVAGSGWYAATAAAAATACRRPGPAPPGRGRGAWRRLHRAANGLGAGGSGARGVGGDSPRPVERPLSPPGGVSADSSDGSDRCRNPASGGPGPAAATVTVGLPPSVSRCGRPGRGCRYQSLTGSAAAAGGAARRGAGVPPGVRAAGRCRGQAGSATAESQPPRLPA